MIHNNDTKKVKETATAPYMRSAMKRFAAFLSLNTSTFLLFCLFAIIGCTSIDCPVQNSVYTKYKALKSDGTPDTLQSMLTVSTTMRNGTDSVLLNRLTQASEFELPISYTDAEDTLFFEITDNNIPVFDTVYVAKNNTPHFESVDCNISFFHDITSVRCTNHRIDSIVINKSSVTYDASTEHFHIYFKALP